MIRGMNPAKAEAIQHIEMVEKELARFAGANVPEVAELTGVITQKKAELEANQTTAGERILDRIATIDVADQRSDPTVELELFYRQWAEEWLTHTVPDPKNVRGRIEKAKSEKKDEIAKAAEKQKQEEIGAQAGEMGHGAAAAPPADSAAGPAAAAGEEKKKDVIQKGECDGDVALQMIKESFGAVKKQPQRGEVQYISEAELKAKWNAVYGAGDWEATVEGKGKLYGWNHNGVNYVNKDTNEGQGTALTTLVHEMLHENSDWSFRAAFREPRPQRGRHRLADPRGLQASRREGERRLPAADHRRRSDAWRGSQSDFFEGLLLQYRPGPARRVGSSEVRRRYPRRRSAHGQTEFHPRNAEVETSIGTGASRG
jgi:hypothetical protein